ncbi:hypothetical protein G6F37_001852 [Rhizopus arrhizus]|nr:hypothetical protein G6F38_002273 [Rhizopus arrhizus]KAG1162769.1 hypothetical protein G6F37_001852 [Rhizopus arrhizus]
MKQPVNKRIATVKKRDGYIYIDPPELSDGIYRPESKNMVERLNAAVYMDMNVPSVRRWLKILGRALYNRREGKEEENVLMRRLPKGYIIVKTNTTHKLAICGHPRGQLFRTLDAFREHLLWLEESTNNKITDLSANRDKCECKKCIQYLRGDHLPEGSVAIAVGDYVPLPTLLKPNVSLLSQP